MFFRIQSLWLVLAAIVIALLFLLPVYGGQVGSAPMIKMLITQNYLLMIVAVLLVIMPLFAAAQYKKRGTQKSIIWLALLLLVVFLFLIWTESQKFVTTHNFTLHRYELSAALPIVAIILLFLAFSAIRKDEKLIKSADRLR